MYSFLSKWFVKSGNHNIGPRSDGRVGANAAPLGPAPDEDLEPERGPDVRTAAAGHHVLGGPHVLRRREGAADVGAAAHRKLDSGAGVYKYVLGIREQYTKKGEND
jgi:hypothetical protein